MGQSKNSPVSEGVGRSSGRATAVRPTTAAMTARVAGDGGGAPFYGPRNIVSMEPLTIDCASLAVIQNSQSKKIYQSFNFPSLSRRASIRAGYEWRRTVLQSAQFWPI